MRGFRAAGLLAALHRKTSMRGDFFQYFQNEITKVPLLLNPVVLHHFLMCNRDARSRKRSLRDPQHHGNTDCRISLRPMDNIRMQDEHICCWSICTSVYRAGTSLAKLSIEYCAALAGRELFQLVGECHHSVR